MIQGVVVVEQLHQPIQSWSNNEIKVRVEKGKVERKNWMVVYDKSKKFKIKNKLKKKNFEHEKNLLV